MNSFVEIVYFSFITISNGTLILVAILNSKLCIMYLCATTQAFHRLIISILYKKINYFIISYRFKDINFYND